MTLAAAVEAEHHCARRSRGVETGACDGDRCAPAVGRRTGLTAVTDGAPTFPGVGHRTGAASPPEQDHRSVGRRRPWWSTALRGRTPRCNSAEVVPFQAHAPPRSRRCSRRTGQVGRGRVIRTTPPSGEGVSIGESCDQVVPVQDQVSASRHFRSSPRTARTGWGMCRGHLGARPRRRTQAGESRVQFDPLQATSRPSRCCRRCRRRTAPAHGS